LWIICTTACLKRVTIPGWITETFFLANAGTTASKKPFKNLILSFPVLLIILLTERGWIQREIKSALDKWLEKLDSDIYFFIPVRLEQCDLPESVSDFQCVNLYEPDGWSKFLKALEKGTESLGLSVVHQDEPEACTSAPVEERLSCPHFQGRNKELSDLKELMKGKQRSIITICGPPGIGKAEVSISCWNHSCDGM